MCSDVDSDPVLTWGALTPPPYDRQMGGIAVSHTQVTVPAAGCPRSRGGSDYTCVCECVCVFHGGGQPPVSTLPLQLTLSGPPHPDQSPLLPEFPALLLPGTLQRFRVRLSPALRELTSSSQHVRTPRGYNQEARAALNLNMRTLCHSMCTTHELALHFNHFTFERFTPLPDQAIF